MAYLKTEFALPPGPPDEQLVEELFTMVLGFKWVTPSKHGGLVPDIPTPPGEQVAAIVAYWREHGTVTIKGRGGQILLWPDRKDRKSTAGLFCWYTPEQAAEKAEWRHRHVEQSTQVAKLLQSPLTIARLERDKRENRSVQFQGYSEDVLRLRGYHEGLLGLFWRNIFGPPFTKLFGERLHHLPTNTARDLGDGYWLVQPYKMPSEAFTEDGRRREAELIAKLGREYFYDMEHEQPPKKRPVIKGVRA